MELSRRSLITSALAGSALTLLPVGTYATASAASPVGDVVGKITVGYQGWFACAGDGAPINGWWHWSQNWSQPPSPSNNNIKAWPDMREYTVGYRTAYANLNNGNPATLFSSYDQQTVDTHFRWMQQNGCDTAALQRFNPNTAEGPTRDAMATKVRSSAEKSGPKFYIMYDVSGWTNMQSEIKTDWSSKMSALTSSFAYAKQNGKPVVGIWGFGFNDANHPWSPSACLDVITWFQGQGCYVMGGVPTWWRTGVNDSRPDYLDVYHAFNMLSPWMVGRIGTAADSDYYYTNCNVGDQADCNSHGIDYQPCVMPGDLSARQRAHGDFMWHQFYNMVRVGAQGIYISMFDEYGEGNQIAETAEDVGMVPANSGLLALDEDGTVCSSDYYLRLTGDGGKMLKGQIALTATRPTPTVLTATNVALGKTATASGSASGYPPANATDGNASTYWESTNNAFPQWLQVDLGSALSLGKVVIKLPPSTSWSARTQTLSVLGSSDGTAFSAVVPSATYSFDPNTNGNSTTITFASTSARYIRLNFTANSGWPAGQAGELEVYPSGTSTSSATLSVTPSSLTFASQNVGTTSAAQAVTVKNTGNASASISSITTSGDFAQTNNYGTSLAAGASCTINATFTPTTTGTRTGTLTINSNATNGTSTVSLTGTGAGSSTTNLALGKTLTASGSATGYPPSNANDNNTSSYWESTNNAFPQWLQVDLGSSTTVGRITITLPPSTSWPARTQTLSILGSSDGTTFSTIVPSATYTFDPNANGNSTTITFASTSARYIRLNFTANSAWPAGQASEFQLYSS